MDVVSEQDRERRKRDFKAVDQAETDANQAKRRQNKSFVQIYPKGFKRLRSLMKDYPLAAQIYAFLAEHIDGDMGAVVASQQLLAEELGVHERSIRRATAWLDEKNIVVRVKVGGAAVYAYCLDPDEVWKSFDEAKDYAAFRTKTLARKADNNDIRRRLKVMLKGNDDAEIPDDPNASADA
jgi:hypothetical protein